jgi:hypothetical protein
MQLMVILLQLLQLHFPQSPLLRFFYSSLQDTSHSLETF